MKRKINTLINKNTYIQKGKELSLVSSFYEMIFWSIVFLPIGALLSFLGYYSLN